MSTGDPTALTKKELRERFRRARGMLTAQEQAEKSARITERIAGTREFREASTVLLYRAVPGEPDLQTLVRHPASSGKRFAYPACVSRTEMKALVPGGWREGSFHIQEPDPERSEEVLPGEIGLVICPGVAFDSRGTRLGMGGGYYDRFLPKCTNAVILLAAFEAQHAENLPREETDVPMDRIVTEEAVYPAEE